MEGAVVVDTMIASAWLGAKQTRRYSRWTNVLRDVRWVLPFVVVAEMRFGAEVTGWGPRRRDMLDRLVSRSGVIPPIEEVTDAYVDLRARCVRDGHGLGAKDHEADRWVAAVAIAGQIPLASEDGIFDHVPDLRRVAPAAE